MSQTNKILMIVFVTLTAFCGLRASANNSANNNDKKNEIGPLFDICWCDRGSRCTIKLYVDTNSQEIDNNVGECIHKCMIDNTNRRRNWFSLSCLQVIFNENHKLPSYQQEEKQAYELLRKKLVELSGIGYKKTMLSSEVAQGLGCHTAYCLSFQRLKSSPDRFDQKLYREAVGIDTLNDNYTELDKKKLLTVALARALLHHEYNHAIHYLLPECIPNVNLGGYISASLDEVDKSDERKWIDGRWKSVPSLLHVCMLSPSLISIGWKCRNFKQVPTGMAVSQSSCYAILHLIKKGADVSVKDSEGMTPLEILNKRVKLLKRVPEYADLTFDDHGVVKALTPAKK